MNTQPPSSIESAPVGRGEGEDTVRPEPALSQPGSPRLREVSLSSSDAVPPHRPLPTLLLALGAVLSFHVAYLTSWGVLAMLLFFCFLVALTRLDTARRAFNYGVGIGLLCYAPHLSFFWNVFVGPASGTVERIAGITGVCALWMVLPIWLGVFLMLAAFVRRRFPNWAALLLIPTLWMGVEYFRSELYPLKFSWLGAGMAVDPDGVWRWNWACGVYGQGFLLCALATLLATGWTRSRKLAFGSAAGFGGLYLFLSVPLFYPPAARYPPYLAGIQLEFPDERAVLSALDRVAQQDSDVLLIVLPEYTFDGPVPSRVRDWCRENGKWLIAGGKTPLGTTNFYNAAFVVSTNGEVVFQQAKSVPIQFFRDGLPAPVQHVWESPWGKIGICICYDLSYTRVTDELIRQGARLIICPTMDVQTWGRYQHELHSRVAPVRAAEYGVPIYRVASSGISQAASTRGRVVASAHFPGQGEFLLAHLTRADGVGSLPLDRHAAPVAVAITALVAVYALFLSLRQRNRAPSSEKQPIASP
jgi:apolipoprotein N-acyltransferase